MQLAHTSVVINHLKGIVFFLVFTILGYPVFDLHSQSFDQTTVKLGNRSSHNDSLLNQLAYRYNQRFFYDPIWFNDIKGSLDPRLTLTQNLAEICHQTGLAYICIDSNNIVFIPSSAEIPKNNLPERDGPRVVGNKAEYGRHSKARITGQVIDGTSTLPLPGVTIVDDKTGKSFVTDVHGAFEMQIPVGKHCFTFRLFGYKTLNECFELVSDGDLNVELFYKSFELKEAVITGTRSDSYVTATSTGFFKLDAKSVKQFPGFMGEHDLIKNITLLPGIQSSGEFGSGFYVHGGGADQNLFLLDGIPMYSTSHLFGLISAINTDVVTGVSIYKSGIPARFGERISSVTDINTGAENPDKFLAKGGIGLINSRLKLESPFGHSKGNIVLSVRGSYSDWMLRSLPDIDLKNSKAGFYDVNGQANYVLNARNTLSISTCYSHDNFSFSSNTNYTYSNLVSSLKWTFLLNKKLLSTLTTGLSNYQLTYLYNDSLKLLSANKVDFGLDYKAIKWKLTWLPGSGHNIETGIDAILYNNQPGILTPLGNESIVEKVVLDHEKGVETSAYLADNWDINPLLSIEAGIRLACYTAFGPANIFVFEPGLPRSMENLIDTLKYNENEAIKTFLLPEPRFSMRYILTENSSIKLGFQHMNQFINLVSNTAIASPTDAWKLSSTNFEPVSAIQLSLGYYLNLHNNMFETSMECFFKKQTNAIEYKNGAQLLLNPHLETDLIPAEGQSYGVELYMKKAAGRLTGWVSYTWSRSQRRTSGTTDDEKINGNNWFAANFDTPHSLTVTANYKLSARWAFSSVFTFNSGRPLTLPEQKYEVNGTQVIVYSERNKYRLPDYHRLDVSLTLFPSLRLSKKLRGSWTLSILNLYGRKNAYSVYYAKDDDRVPGARSTYHLYKMYILGQPIPTLTYSFAL